MIEWTPLDFSEWPIEALDGAIEIVGLPRHACAQVYQDEDPEMRPDGRPFHWYVDIPGIDGDSDTGYCATEREAKATVIRVCRDMGLIDPAPIEAIADDVTLPLFGDDP